MRLSTSFVVLILALHAISLINVEAYDQIQTTREEILASRKRRSDQLEKMLEEAKLQLDDHNLGRRLLEEEEKIKIQKKVDIFERKLQSMQMELDEREIERMLKREEIRNERVKDRLERRERRERGLGDEL